MLAIFYIVFLKLSEAYVLYDDIAVTSEPFNANDVSDDSPHIGKIIKPSDIREPKTLQEIINYVDVKPKAGETQFHINREDDERADDNRQAVSYNELIKYLSLWEWAKQQNFYNMSHSHPSPTTIKKNRLNEIMADIFLRVTAAKEEIAEDIVDKLPENIPDTNSPAIPGKWPIVSTTNSARNPICCRNTLTFLNDLNGPVCKHSDNVDKIRFTKHYSFDIETLFAMNL
uniref:Uncharacterized protein n=1 Tax=Glossina palpalis gambiensis TaxID=67801 RepID=A0A1B0B6C3_9MUSC